VFDDADLEKATAAAVAGFTTLCGQACVAPTRLLVQDSVYAEVQERLATATAAIRIGDPMDPSTMMGPLITSRARDRVVSTVERAVSEEAGKLVTGGRSLGGVLSDGFFISPALFVDVDPHSDLARNEIFGPVLAVTPFGEDAEAISLANDSQYGLAAYLHTRDLTRAHQVAAQLDAGNISINGGIRNTNNSPVAPFGGFKDSGYGKEGGLEGLMEFHRIKNIHVAY
jgi:aldehyde dehydrogenase (NAD+)